MRGLLLGGALCAAIVAMGLSGGCSSSYATPGRGAAMSVFGPKDPTDTDPALAATIGKKPQARFPTAIAAVRVQAPGYTSKWTASWGSGNYCVVTTHDVETDAQLKQLDKLPMVLGVAPINRLLLPEKLNSDLELRQAAAALRADVLLVYTLDTTFNVQDKAAPLSAITLGLFPTVNADVICTASAVLLDTHNGYVYGVAEGTDRSSQLADAWTSDAAVDAAVRRTEAGAFNKLVANVEQAWTGVIASAAQESAAATQPVQ